MRILITGATGFLGSHLCRRLAHEGHDLTILRRSSSDSTSLVGLVYDEEIGDVTGFDSLRKAVENQDVVIHAAAHLAYWRGLKELQNRVNIDGTRNVVRVCQESGVGKLLLISSTAAIGISEDPGRPADESFQFNLQNSPLNYAISKWRAEQEVLQGFKEGLPAVIINPSSIFGPYRSGYRGGEMIKKAGQGRFVPHFKGGINAVHVEDVVSGIIRALSHGRPGERYILAGENLTFRQIVVEAARQLERQPLFLPIPRVVTGLASAFQEPLSLQTGRRPRFTYDLHFTAGRFQYYDAAKARRELDFQARPFAEIVAECLGGGRSSRGEHTDPKSTM